MKHKYIILLVSFLVIAVTMLSLAGCKPKSGKGKAPEEKPESSQNYVSQDEKASEKPNENPNKKPKGYDWTIDVDDTIPGSYTYQVPDNNLTLKYNITLRLVAWKSGGEDVYGKYEGEAYIVFRFDESGLSNEEVVYAGGGAFNRRCEKLEFTVEKYDSGKYGRDIVSFSGTPLVIPIRTYNAMSSFISKWSTILEVDDAMKDADTGAALLQRNDQYSDGSLDNMGIKLLIDDKEGVVVEIPTYRLGMDSGYFLGTVKRSPLGTAKRVKLEMPGGDGSVNSNAAADGEEKGSAGSPYDWLYDKSSDTYVERDPNGLTGYDTNGDGYVDFYYDENGNPKVDMFYDGTFEDPRDPKNYEFDFSDVQWGEG